VIAGIKAKATDGDEYVVMTDVDRDVTAWSGLAVGHEVLAGHRATDKAGIEENVRYRARAVVATVLKEAMATTPDVGFALEAIGGCNSVVDGSWHSPRGCGVASVVVEELRGGSNG
jgi:hypothetical protein